MNSEGNTQKVWRRERKELVRNDRIKDYPHQKQRSLKVQLVLEGLKEVLIQIMLLE